MRVCLNWLNGDEVFESITPLQLPVLLETRKCGSTLQLDEDEVRTSFTPLQMDVFHALWGFHHGADCRVLIRQRCQQGDNENRVQEQRCTPAGDQEAKGEFLDIRSQQNIFREVYGFQRRPLSAREVSGWKLGGVQSSRRAETEERSGDNFVQPKPFVQAAGSAGNGMETGKI